MTGDHLSQDRLLALSRGAPCEGPLESGHLEGCPECRLEVSLARAAGSLGRLQAEQLDTGRSATAVLKRLGSQPASPGSLVQRVTPWLFGLAAAAVLVLALLPRRSAAPAGPLPVRAEAVLHELDSLSSTQLEALLETMAPPAGQTEHVDEAPLSELDAHDLERVLHSME